jgi:very-short-patch-repair endonuclease
MNLVAPPPGTKVRFRDIYASKPLLTDNEARFFRLLHQLSQGRCQLFAKVNLADIMTTTQKGAVGDRNKFDKKHVDFLVCRNEDWMPMLGIELDDSSHNNKQTQKRDRDKNDLFAAIGLPLLRLPLNEIDQHEELIRQLSDAWHQRWHILETGELPPKTKPIRKPLWKLWSRKEEAAASAA